MNFIETTITEHIYNQGWIKGEAKGEARGETRGEARGEARGEVNGKKETAINLLKMGVDVKIISQATGFNEKEIKQLTVS
ncbi:hypothetical protein [Candidatus Parabeggiatoa sp. HSG14]|uniref:hypothetical protein n=1 Tax=Candidatus Parabeggiatoa sp. HSG14 TaxID=3055593 RepID=UPI0025A69156|nr:hypothetical protein [Thiotrichales bacterium HSG14]